MRARRLLRSVSTGLLDLVFPPQCAACGRLGAGVCATCLAALRPLPTPQCRQCNRYLRHGDRCAECRHEDRRIEGVFVRYPYATPLREAVQRLKYANKRYLVRDLAHLAVPALPSDLCVDAITPVPLHPARQAARGFNQSALLAGVVGALIDRPVRPELLRRIRDTPPQVNLPRRERLANVRGAFVCDCDVAGLRVLLVDDVVTTGGTLEAAAAALRACNVAWVAALVVARQPAGETTPRPAANT